MTPEEEAALLAQGQQLADQQLLETLLTLDDPARAYFDSIYEVRGGDLDDFVQYWRETYGGDPPAGL